MIVRGTAARFFVGSLEWLACLFLGGVFLAAALPKLADPAGFALAVHQYRLLPGAAVNIAAIYLPWLELTCAGALVFVPKARRGVLWMIAALLALFTAAMFLALVRGVAVPCGCFGGDGKDDPAGWVNILRNLGLIALSFLAMGLRALRTWH